MNFWYQITLKARALMLLLLPFSWAFCVLTFLRRIFYQKGLLKSYKAPVPVIIVGNLSVGGNGKTPVTLWLAEHLTHQGKKVGIISRGYGSRSAYYPRLVEATDKAIEVGDEPLLLRQRSGVPLCIGANRRESIELLLKHHSLDVIISDDGLQHYALQRDLEIVVIDAERQLGNGKLLPAGPLRESQQRLKTVDVVINNGSRTPYSDIVMHLKAEIAQNLKTGEKRSLSDFAGIEAQALAGIGNPERFFTMLKNKHIPLTKTLPLADHQAFTPELLKGFSEDIPLFMTEKDAVKCLPFAQQNWWFVPVVAEMEKGKILSKTVAGLFNE